MFTIRNAEPTDMNLIISTYLKGAKYGSDYFKAIDEETFYQNYGSFVENRVRNANVIVCCLEEDADVIVGYLVHRGPVIDWLYVKTAFRRQGVANSLLKLIEPAYTTGYSKAGAAIAKKKKVIMNPWL